MAEVLFFEKPGCVNNTRQKTLLAEAGHRVEARDLLAEPWTAERLRPFFGALPVSDWFNRTAPRIKSGEVDPDALDEPGALAAMVADPLFIRRPLMQAAGERRVGFDPAAVDAWLGLPQAGTAGDVETCRRPEHPCKPEVGE